MQNVVDRVDPRVTFWLGLTAALGITPFVIVHIIRGDIFMGGLTASLDLLLFAIIWETWRTKHTPVRGLVACTVAGSVVVFLVGLHLKMAGVLWAYPFIGFAYFFLGVRHATWLVAFFYPAVIAGAYSWANSEEFPRIVATLALNWLFSAVFAINNHRQQSELAHLAASDPLTGAGNRRAMHTELARAVSLHERHGTPFSLIMCDLDWFKKINDNHGHGTGDAVLIDLVKLVGQRLRKIDRLFRIGGEEFIVFLPLTPKDEAIKVAESLRKMVEDSTLGELRDVTISAGVAALRRGEDVSAWIKRTDEALYDAKAKGRNRVEVSNPDSAHDVKPS